MDDSEKVYPLTPFMDIYNAKIQSAVSLEQLKLIMLVRWDFHNKEMIGGKWATTVSMTTQKCLLVDDSKHR